MTLHFTVLTLFPELFPGPLGASVTGRALEQGTWCCDAVNIRDYATDPHKTVDDIPYGGGAGMVMKPDILGSSIEAASQQQAVPSRRIYLSPRGKPLTQPLVQELAAESHITLLCGRYEGVDQRVLDAYDFDEVSIGDIVLSGGELAAFPLMDAIIRLLPGVLGHEESASEESFGDGAYADLLEYPHYTRPASWQGREVPEILRSGDHAKIANWRLHQAEKLTKERRPELWRRYEAAQGENDD